EADPAVDSFHVAASDGSRCPADLLVDVRAVHRDRAACHGEYEIAVVLNVDAGPSEGQGDDRRVSAWRHDEVILEPALIAVIHDVNPRIDAWVAHLGKGGHVPVPLRRVVAQEIVRLAGELVLSSGPRCA